MNNIPQDFMLSEVYCLHNGAFVLKQKNDSVKKSLIDNNNEQLKSRLTHAVQSRLRVCHGTKSTENGKRLSAEFLTLTKEEFTRRVSEFYSETNGLTNTNSSAFKKLDSGIEIPCRWIVCLHR